MTTTYDAEPTCDTIAAAYYDDPETYTIAEAWNSSPLGELDDDITEVYPSADTDKEPRRQSRGSLFAALAAGIIGGATIGAVLFGSIEPAKPTVIVPDSGVSTSPLPAGSTAPSSQQAPVEQSDVHSMPVTAPKPAVPEPKPAAAIAPAPNAVVDPAAPPVLSAPPVVVDVFIPPHNDDPQPPAPKPQPPKPPVFDPGNIEIAQVPQPEDNTSRWQINPDVTKKPGRMQSIAPKNDKPQRTQINTDDGSRFNIKIDKP